MFFYGEPLPKQREKCDLTQKNGDLPSFHWAVGRIWDLNRSESKLSLHTGKLGMGHATNDFPREWGGWTSNYSKNSTWQTKSQKFYSYPYSHVVDACWNAQELILWFHIWPKRTWRCFEAPTCSATVAGFSSSTRRNLSVPDGCEANCSDLRLCTVKQSRQVQLHKGFQASANHFVNVKAPKCQPRRPSSLASLQFKCVTKNTSVHSHCTGW